MRSATAPALLNPASITLLFLAAAVSTRGAVPPRYRWGIVAGLGFSAVGDAFLMQPVDYFLQGLGSFLAAHLCYLRALTSDCRLAGRKCPFAVWAAVGLVLMAWLWPGIPAGLRIPVALYTLALLGMAAQAASRALELGSVAAVAAAVGAVLFVASDFVLAFQRFRHPFEWGRFIVLGTYFAAQASIALSVVLAANARLKPGTLAAPQPDA